MIDTDQVGNKKILGLIIAEDWEGWSEWEREFIRKLNGNKYERLSSKMKNKVGELYDKWECRA